MSLKCRINNGIVEAPNGAPSILYKKLIEKFGQEDGLLKYALTETLDYKDNLIIDKDVNGEMPFDSFLRFIYSEEVEVPKKNMVDLQHKIPKNKIKNLQKVYNQGIFQPTEENLKATGVFTEDEIIEIIYSPYKKLNLKAFIENSEELDVSLKEVFIENSEEYNDIGLNTILDPGKVKKDILSIIYKSTTKREVASLMQTIDYPNTKKRYNEDQGFKDYIDNLALNTYEIPIIKDEENTYNTLLNTVDVSKFYDTSKTIDRINTLTDKNLIVEEFDILIENLIFAGVEINFEEDFLLNKSIEELKKFANSLQNFVNNPSENTTKDFSKQIDNFKNKEKTKLVHIDSTINKKTLGYTETTKDEVEMYNRGFIKHRENVYQKVNNKVDVFSMYEVLYNKILSGEISINLSKIPSVEGSVEALKNPINKDVVIEDLQNMVREVAIELPFTDIETQESITLYKKIYKANILESIEKEVIFPLENEEYLIEEFPSVFNNKKLEEKRNQSENYDNFYKYFNVDQRGIYLKEDTPYIREIVENTMPEGIKKDLKNYSILSKSLNLETEPQLKDEFIKSRLNAQQNPKSLNKLDKNYQLVGENEIVTESLENFVSVRGEAYEKLLDKGGKALYKKLPKIQNNYKNTNTKQPITLKKDSFLDEFIVNEENTVKYKKYLSKEEVEEIKEKHFNCR